MTTERDLRNQMSLAKKEGQDTERKAIALKLLQKGIPVNEVAELTSLHVDEVTALQYIILTQTGRWSEAVAVAGVDTTSVEMRRTFGEDLRRKM